MKFVNMDITQILLLLLWFGSTVRRISSSPVSIDNYKFKYLFNKNLTEIPRNLDHGITHLILDQNYITRISNLHNYPALEYLTLSANQIATDNDLRGISAAKNLTFVDLSNNGLLTLNMKTFELNSKLKWMYLDNNTNVYIDGVISNMPNLQELSLENCNLNELPWTDFTGAPNLTRLNVLGNPIGDIPKKIINSMPQSLELLVDRELYLRLLNRSDVKDKTINLKCSKENTPCRDFVPNVADRYDMKNQTTVINKSDISQSGSKRFVAIVGLCVIGIILLIVVALTVGIVIYQRKWRGTLKISFDAPVIFNKNENNSEAQSETSPLNEDVPEIVVDENNHTTECFQRETTV